MTDLQAVLDEREIERQLSRAVRIQDERAWDTLAEVFAEDLTFDYFEGQDRSGLAALRQLLSGFLDRCGPTQHLTGSLIVTVSGDAAASRVYVLAQHQGAGDRSHLFYDASGEFVDKWERRPEGWRIVRRDVRFIYGRGDFDALGSAVGLAESR